MKGNQCKMESFGDPFSKQPHFSHSCLDHIEPIYNLSLQVQTPVSIRMEDVVTCACTNLLVSTANAPQEWN